MITKFSVEDDRKCLYKGEIYSVRDNGMVFRHPREGTRVRKYDNHWSYGNLNSQKGYLEIASVPVHRIVATAFHGEAPTKEHVVDHIDTNKQNNRPENLRWLTRLENILLNPITAKRIALICGSVEAFLENPAGFRDKFTDPNYEWMCVVSKEEAAISRERLLSWARSDKPLKGGSLDAWIFKSDKQAEEEKLPNFIMSKTPNAAQRIVFNYQDKPNEYPCTPQVFKGSPLEAYYQNLARGSVYFRNHNGDHLVINSGFSKDKQSLYVLTVTGYTWEEANGDHLPVPIAGLADKITDETLPDSLAIVTYEDGLFVHDRATGGFHPHEELIELFNEYTS